jgi:hypothetical protein
VAWATSCVAGAGSVCQCACCTASLQVGGPSHTGVDSATFAVFFGVKYGVVTCGVVLRLQPLTSLPIRFAIKATAFTHPPPHLLTHSLTHSLFHCLSVQAQREHHLPPGAFPDVNRFTDIMSAFISHPACCCHLVFGNTIVQYSGSAHSVTRSPSHPPTHTLAHSLTHSLHRLCTSSRSTQSLTHSLLRSLSVCAGPA